MVPVHIAPFEKPCSSQASEDCLSFWLPIAFSIKRKCLESAGGGLGPGLKIGMWAVCPALSEPVHDPKKS